MTTVQLRPILVLAVATFVSGGRGGVGEAHAGLVVAQGPASSSNAPFGSPWKQTRARRAGKAQFGSYPGPARSVCV